MTINPGLRGNGPTCGYREIEAYCESRTRWPDQHANLQKTLAFFDELCLDVLQNSEAQVRTEYASERA
jgi:hypothetical protein